MPVLVQTYIHNGLTYVSQLLHNVRVTGLPYGQTIYYKCAHTCLTSLPFLSRQCFLPFWAGCASALYPEYHI